MARYGTDLSRKRFIPAMLAAAGLVLAIPGAGLAVNTPDRAASTTQDVGFLPFTPARIDADLARQVEAAIGTEGLRFTPASNIAGRKDRTVTVAVRVDKATARAISVRNVLDSVGGDSARAAAIALAPTRYNLGIARGYQSFAQTTRVVEIPAGARESRLADLGKFDLESANKPSKPSRFQTRLALEQDSGVGATARSPGTPGDQTVDVGGSYRLLRNLDLTAGVRLSQDRDRLDPLTDGVEDSQAVYVGTQIRF